jgi:hypothetical protein
VRASCRQLVDAAAAVHFHRRRAAGRCLCGAAAGLASAAGAGPRLGLRLRRARQLPRGRRQAGVVWRQPQPVRLANLRQRLRVALLSQRRENLQGDMALYKSCCSSAVRIWPCAALQRWESA